MVYPGSPALDGVDHDEVLNSKTIDLIFRFHTGRGKDGSGTDV